MATALPSSWDSDAESEKVRKAKKSKKTGKEEWSDSLVPHYWPCLWNILLR